MTRELVLWIPRLPPSVNALHVHRRGGGVAYTPEAAAFDDAARRYTATHYAVEIETFCRGIEPEVLLEARYIFFTRRFFATGWWLPRTAGGDLPRETAAPYLPWDVTNRVKVVEDAVVRLTGIDDRRYRRSTADKYPAELPEDEGVLVRLREIHPYAGLFEGDPEPMRRLLDIGDLGLASGKPALCARGVRAVEASLSAMQRIYGAMFYTGAPA